MFRYEWKKSLFYRKGLLLIVVFLIAELLSLLLFTQPYDKDLETNRAVYDQYLQQVEGPLTPEKRAWLEDEMLRLDTANIKLEQLKSDYYTGAMDETEFREKFDLLAAENDDYPGFSKLYTQYIYVRETDQRFFLYTGGWEVLLGDWEPDYLFLLLLIFLLTPIFCQEYGNQMDQILLTQRKSAKYIWQTKVAMALMVTAILTAVLQLFDLAYCAFRFGLPHWSYSLQSLYSFGSVQKELTLWQAFLLQFALKEFGYLYVALLLLCISVVVKKYAHALMAGIVLLPIPFLTINSNSSFLRIPGPWALTIGSIYLGGGENEVTWNQLGLILAASAAVCLVLILCIHLKNINHHVKRKPAKAMAGMLALVLLLSGCGNRTEAVIYNSSTSGCYESDTHIYMVTGSGIALLIDKQTGKVSTFPMDAFQNETVGVNRGFYYEDGEVYYLKTNRQYQSGNASSPVDYYSLVALDVDTLEERSVYRWNLSSHWFFGLLDRESQEPNPFGIGTFFLNNNNLYYDQNSVLYVMDLQTGKYEEYLTLPGGAYFCFDGQYLYYPDRYNRLVKHDLDTKKEEVMDDVVASKFAVMEDGIYFLNIRDHNTLYYWNEAKQTVTKLDNTQSHAIYADENYCWINSLDGFFRVNKDGSDKRKLDCPGFLCGFSSESALYLYEYETDTIYAVDKETLEWTTVVR